MDISALREQARRHVDSGAFAAELATMVAHRTVSGDPDRAEDVRAYLENVLRPALADLGCDVAVHENPDPRGGPIIVGRRVESPDLPTVLCYGHADVTPGQEEQWRAGLDPWTLTVEGERWYGRGAADNKGQHLTNITALRFLLAERGSLGSNLTYLIESGEEIGSPGLAEFAAAHRELLRADVLIGSDGPRLDAATPTLFLGARGGLGITLKADLRPGSHHSGNWGGVLRNPATTLAGAISAIVDGHGRIRVPGLRPPEVPAAVRAALAGIAIGAGPGDPALDETWGQPDLTPAERLYAGNTIEVIALDAGDPQRPVGAIPGRARAFLQLRYVAGTEVGTAQKQLAEHLAEHGYPMVGATVTGNFPASRTPLDDPWVVWARRTLEEACDGPVALLPNIGGGLPNHVFTDVLGLPTLWLPHSYPGCRQHAPDEHLLAPIAREGIVLAAALFDGIGHGRTAPRSVHGPRMSGPDS